VDFCRKCFPSEAEAEAEYGDESKTGPGPDDRGNCFEYNSDHPDYEDVEYRCEKCNRLLHDKDNFPKGTIQ
jgi:hypothetical protein